MRLRLIVFLPAAALITFVLIGSASSLVSALERSLMGEEEAPPLRITRYETECDVLYREIHTLSHEVTTCETDPECSGSPLLCPVVMNEDVSREYQRLRTALNQKCGVSLGLMDYVWGGPVWGEPTQGPEQGVVPSCGESHDWLEARANGHADAERFEF